VAAHPRCHDFLTHDDKSWQDDVVGFGTAAAGLITATEARTKILGIAPEVDLHACKVSPGGQIGDLVEAFAHHAVDLAESDHREVQLLRIAPLYVLSPSMCDVMVAAARTLTLPDLTLLDEVDLPLPRGLPASAPYLGHRRRLASRQAWAERVCRPERVSFFHETHSDAPSPVAERAFHVAE
jgi:hypothetical protein